MSKTNKAHTDNPYANLTMQEAQLIYRHLFENADYHRQIAKLLAQNEHYGMANGHLVLAAENYLQGLSVHFVGWGLPVEQFKRIAGLFSQTDSGWQVSPLAMFAGLYLRAIYNLFEGASGNLLNANWQQLFQKATDTNLNPITIAKKSAQFTAWWNSARELQNKSFNVVLNVNLSTPAQQTLNDYSLSENIVNELRENCWQIMEFTKKIPDKQRTSFFNWMKTYLEPILNAINKFSFDSILKK